MDSTRSCPFAVLEEPAKLWPWDPAIVSWCVKSADHDGDHVAPPTAVKIDEPPPYVGRGLWFTPRWAQR